MRSERSIEYQNLALMQDALGDRAHALESYRQNQALKLDILRTNPDYRKIRRSLGMATVMLGSALARSGLRQEALTTIQQGITFYDSVPKGDDEINVKRERTVSLQKLGEILVMNEDTKAALLDYQRVRATLQPMAQADPQNTMLQLDVASTDFHFARALVILGRHDEAIPRLRHAASVFTSLHANARSADDSPHGLGAIEIWLGEAYAGKGNVHSALQQYEKATQDLTPSPAVEMDADTRCELAMSYAKSAAALARLGNLAEAEKAYEKALDTVTPLVIPEHRDVPALYILADASAGLADVITQLAHNMVDPKGRAHLEERARTLHQQAVNSWAQIPNPSRINASGFLATAPLQGTGRFETTPTSSTISKH